MDVGLEFDWDEANASHIARHEVSPKEAEEVIQNSLFIPPLCLLGHENAILGVDFALFWYYLRYFSPSRFRCFFCYLAALFRRQTFGPGFAAFGRSQFGQSNRRRVLLRLCRRMFCWHPAVSG